MGLLQFREYQIVLRILHHLKWKDGDREGISIGDMSSPIGNENLPAVRPQMIFLEKDIYLDFIQVFRYFNSFILYIPLYSHIHLVHFWSTEKFLVFYQSFPYHKEIVSHNYNKICSSNLYNKI